MKVSGFSIVRNAVKYNYPVLESIESILPICDEFIINIGDSEDDTRELIRSILNPKIKIIERRWDMSAGKEVLSYETNVALKACRGDWAFYLQADELIHEDDLPLLKRCMEKYAYEKEVETLRFKWLHFYGSYFRYRIDNGWFQKQDRIIKNNEQVESFGDAFGFKRKDNQPLKRKNTDCLLYHYGWVHSEEVMASRRKNAQAIGFASHGISLDESGYSYGDLNRFPIYWGTHPRVMEKRIGEHPLSQEDFKMIQRKYQWHPLRLLRPRYKTWKRVKERIE